MAPIAVMQNKKGLQLTHRCTKCAREQRNIVALDTIQDDMDALVEFMQKLAVCATQTEGEIE